MAAITTPRVRLYSAVSAGSSRVATRVFTFAFCLSALAAYDARAVTDASVEQLRQQLRERGYLSRGIERWFALDPWQSRTFWSELLVVALKGGVLTGGAIALTATAIMLLRNPSAGVIDGVVLLALYATFGIALGAAIVIVLALGLKSRPEIALDRPATLLAIAIGSAAVMLAPLVMWWRGFEGTASRTELIVGSLMLAATFAIAVIAISAALLSFSIYELRRIPAIHRTSRVLPLAVGALAFALAGLFATAGAPRGEERAPQQVLVSPVRTRIALIAVDGLSDDLLASRPSLARRFRTVKRVAPLPGSTAERWSSLGTGTAPQLHGVHAIEGFRVIGSARLLQSVSIHDAVLRTAAAARLAARQPMPPSVRRRDFVWEIVGARGVPAVAVNWWTSPDQPAGQPVSIAQSGIFTAAKNDALRVDALAAARLERESRRIAPESASLVSVYLPALDIVLNRTADGRGGRVAQSLRALDGIERTVDAMRAAGYEVIVAGMPGEQQEGHAVIASSIALDGITSPYDLAPTLCSLFGFPASREMRGRSAVREAGERLASYGPRSQRGTQVEMSQDYYESLRSLGYIQ